MLGPLLLAAVLVAPSPTPTPASNLKTIASVRSTSRCAEIITHANSAIGTDLNNDVVLGETIAALRFTDLDSNPLSRRNGLERLGDYAKTLMEQARSADDQVKRLRAIAATTKDPEQAKALKDFADELGGALWRQQKIARDLNGFLAYEDFVDMSKPSEGEQQMNEGNFGNTDPQTQLPVDAVRPVNEPIRTPELPWHIETTDPNQPTTHDYAVAAARDFENRTAGIRTDENAAASHVDGALGSCQ
jgi:hypothetical protein